jgi:hypothetical protein
MTSLGINVQDPVYFVKPRVQGLTKQAHLQLVTRFIVAGELDDAA